MIQVEYILLVENAGSFCENAEAFSELLNVDSLLTVSDGKLTYKGGTVYDYEIQVGEVATKGERYFQLNFSLNEDPNENNIETFTEMLRVVRPVTQQLSDKLEVLRDDVSTYFSELGYMKIHQIENLMRRLITNFMVVNVGTNWVKESFPQPAKDALESSKRKNWTTNVLDEIDFIVLSQYLLHPYCIGPTDKILRELPNINTPEELEAFKNRFELKSNWTRYFSEVVDCEEEFLRKRWSDLYDLRCKIAHNAFIKKQDYERIVQLADEVEEPLLLAVEKIREVAVPEEELQQIVDEADATSSSSYLAEWQRLLLFSEQMKELQQTMNPGAGIAEQMKELQQTMNPGAAITKKVKKKRKSHKGQSAHPDSKADLPENDLNNTSSESDETESEDDIKE